MLKVCLVSVDNLGDVKITLESLSNLDLNFEVVIVDSSSDSKIAYFVDNLQSFRINYIWEQKKGIYHAMNTAWNSCNQDDLIWFLNPGDRLLSSNTLLNLIDGIESNGHEWGFAQAVTNESSINFYPSTSAMLTKQALHEGTLCISHQAMLVKNYKIKDLGGFNEKYSIAADLDIEFKLIKSSSPFFEKAPMVLVDSTGVSHQFILKTIMESALVRRDNDLISRVGFLVWISKRILNKIFLSIRTRLS